MAEIAGRARPGGRWGGSWSIGLGRQSRASPSKSLGPWVPEPPGVWPRAGGACPQGALSPAGGPFWEGGSGAHPTCPLLSGTCMALPSFFTLSPILHPFFPFQPLSFDLHSILYCCLPAPREPTFRSEDLNQILSGWVDFLFTYTQGYSGAPTSPVLNLCPRGCPASVPQEKRPGCDCVTSTVCDMYVWACTQV